MAAFIFERDDDVGIYCTPSSEEGMVRFKVAFPFKSDVEGRCEIPSTEPGETWKGVWSELGFVCEPAAFAHAGRLVSVSGGG